MICLRFARWLTLAAGVALATGTAAGPPESPPPARPPDGDAAQRSSPAQAEGAASDGVRASPELPPAARAGAWRSGARPPGDVPATMFIRAAAHERGPDGKRAARPGGDPSKEIEIVWHAPGS